MPRCFLYLFPSHQTWYLVFVLIAFMCVRCQHTMRKADPQSDRTLRIPGLEHRSAPA